MRKLVGVYGAGGMGREVMPLVKHQYPECELFFVVDNPTQEKVAGYQVINFQDFASREGDKSMTIGIGNSQLREMLSKQCLDAGVRMLDVRASTAILLEDVEIGEGAVLCHYTHLTSNITIGKQFQANIYSSVSHDCVIGDYVTFAPGVRCNGNIHIEDHAYIGSGAVIKQGTPEKPIIIGKGAVVGMGAVVTKSVPPAVTVFGNPARLFK